MLTTKLNTRPSPPKLSIFWSVPWPNEKIHRRQICLEIADREYARGESLSSAMRMATLHDEDTEGEYVQLHTLQKYSDLSPNWGTARKIVYRGCELRVFSVEFSAVENVNLKQHIAKSHEFVAEGVAAESLVGRIQGEVDSDLKTIYEAALLDGCDPQQATATALGIDLTLPDPDFPPLGWYRIRPEFGRVFCSDEELQEHLPISESAKAACEGLSHG